MTTDPPCPRRDKWFRGCRFEPRYDVGEPDFSRFKGLSGPEAVAFVQAMKPTTYVHDVCVVCGKVVAPEIHNEHDSPSA